MRAVDIIIRKKEGKELSEAEIDFMIKGFVSGRIPDYQISAWLMAVCLRGMSDNELFTLTKVMYESGEQIDLTSIKGICVDKHSTGGVGDKTTLVIAPLLAACGLKTAKMSGRGLGHTGGTLDKLEAIPGFKINLTGEDFRRQVDEIGLAVAGQTANIAPADKKLYALRDVTGTVESIGLIAGSVMSKKLASGAKIILLDVKVGNGAFMKNREDARKLATAMVNIGCKFNRKTVAMLTDMDQPLGEAVGNGLEVIEAIETLKGKGPEDFTELCYRITAEMLILAGVKGVREEAYRLIKEKIASGEALDKFRQMIIRQSGNPAVIEDYALLSSVKEKVVVKAKAEGYVVGIRTNDIGRAAMLLGAGRNTTDDVIDPNVGIIVKAKKGDYLHIGDPLAIVYTNGRHTDEVATIIDRSYELSRDKPDKKEIVLEIIGD